MLTHPRIPYQYHAEFLESDQALLLSEREKTLLRGKVYHDVLWRLRDGGLSVETLIQELEPHYTMPEVLKALTVLEQKGYLCETVPDLSPEICAYWSSLGIEPARLQQTLAEKSVTLQFVGNVPQDEILQAFTKMGIASRLRSTPGSSLIERSRDERSRDERREVLSLSKGRDEERAQNVTTLTSDETGQPPALCVVVCDDYERPQLRDINQIALQTGIPWLLLKPQGVDIWLGPLFQPGQTGCWECLRQRLRNNRPMYTFFQHQTGRRELPPIPVAGLTATYSIAANLLAVEVARWLVCEANERLSGKIVVFDTAACCTQTHTLVKRPQCPVCGEERRKTPQPPAPLQLRKSAEVCVAAQGGYRDALPEDTIERYQRHVSPITGVVQALKPYYPSDGAPVYNYFSGVNVALQSKTLFWLNFHIRGTNGGKGANWAQARAGALCEAIERYSCTFQGDEYLIRGSLRSLGPEAIHPNACMNFSAQQYQQRESSNQQSTKFYHLVPRPFDETLDMEWAPVYSLTEQRFKYLPACFCYAQYPAEDEYQLFAYPDSNGNAAGNTLEEAILQGFLELVERDSVALWWYNRLRKPAVDLTSFQNPYIERLRAYYASLERSLYVLDLTADLQIPAFGAFSHRLRGEPQEPIFGFGAHVDAGIALERALVELNQILPIVQVSDARRERAEYRIKDTVFRDWLSTATLDNQPYLQPDHALPRRTAAEYPRVCAPNIYESVLFCLDTAARHNLEMLALDLTRIDVGLPVVKVIVPGLRHFWKRLAPGRLYDVPVAMGWLPAPLQERELNQIGLFI